MVHAVAMFLKEIATVDIQALHRKYALYSTSYALYSTSCVRPPPLETTLGYIFPEGGLL